MTLSPFSLRTLIPSSLILLGTLFSVPMVGATDDAQTFADVNENHRYFRSIEQLAGDDVIQGFPIGTFLPERSVNRVEALKIILESFPLNEEIPPQNDEPLTLTDFSDVSDDVWYSPYINTAVEHGIIRGYDDRTFRPNNTLNRAEAIKMIIEAVDTNNEIKTVHVEIDPALDTPQDSWFAPYFQYGLTQSMLYLDAHENLNPGAIVSRGELTDLIYRLKYPGTYTGIVSHGNMTYYADKFHGRNTASGEVFDQEKLTAAHPTLPFGTKLRVSNRWTGESVEVTVNDRGPYNNHAIIDLSRSAFESIARLSSGIVAVEIEIIYKEDETS